MRKLARTDTALQKALSTLVEMRPGLLVRHWELRPEDSETRPAVTWRYNGMLVAEEALGASPGQFRHQYLLVVHGGNDRDVMKAVVDLAVGALQTERFRAILQPEVLSDDGGDYAIGVLAERV